MERLFSWNFNHFLIDKITSVMYNKIIQMQNISLQSCYNFR